MSEGKTRRQMAHGQGIEGWASGETGTEIRVRRFAPRSKRLARRPSHSAEEARMAVLVNQRDEFLDGRHLRHGIVAVPLQIPALPEDPPSPACTHVRGFGHRTLELLPGLAFPHGADFKDLDALTQDAKSSDPVAVGCVVAVGAAR